jgi:trimeric autotransporter adhesin
VANLLSFVLRVSSRSFSNTIGRNNTAEGLQALNNNTMGINNAGVGVNALFSNTTGNLNVGLGVNSLLRNTTGSSNIALGVNAGGNLTIGNSNIDIGNAGVAAEGNTTRVGTQGTQRRAFIAGISGTAVTGSPVVVNASGQLGVAASSERFKDEIKPMNNVSEAILALQPVTFRYKKTIDPDRVPQFGLVAEDVAKVNPDLVARDAKGEVYTVRYEAVNAMLLNEFIKAHRKNEEQEKTIAELKSGMTALAATVKEQASQIQKVSAQLATASPSRGGLEASKFATRRIRGGGPTLRVANNL